MSNTYRNFANHTLNTGILPNPALAEETIKTVDIVVVNLITNRIKRFIIQLWPLSNILLTHLCLASHKRDTATNSIDLDQMLQVYTVLCAEFFVINDNTKSNLDTL